MNAGCVDVGPDDQLSGCGQHPVAGMLVWGLAVTAQVGRYAQIIGAVADVQFDGQTLSAQDFEVRDSRWSWLNIRPRTWSASLRHWYRRIGQRVKSRWSRDCRRVTIKPQNQHHSIGLRHSKPLRTAQPVVPLPDSPR